MRFKIVTLVMTVFVLAACESPATDEAASTGEGAVTNQTSTDESQMARTSTDNMESRGPMTPDTEEFVRIGDRVFFAFDRYDLNTAARRTLERQSEWLKAHADVAVTIAGHADERGTREYNLALGERRATSVKNYLVALGIDPNRVKTISFGKERPVDPRSNEEAWAKNRRGVTELDRTTVGLSN